MFCPETFRRRVIGGVLCYDTTVQLVETILDSYRSQLAKFGLMRRSISLNDINMNSSMLTKGNPAPSSSLISRIIQHSSIHDGTIWRDALSICECSAVDWQMLSPTQQAVSRILAFWNGKRWVSAVNDEANTGGHLSGQATPCCDGNLCSNWVRWWCWGPIEQATDTFTTYVTKIDQIRGNLPLLPLLKIFGHRI